MNSYISLVLAAERARDMQRDAAVARYHRQARRLRRAARHAQVAQQTVHGQAPDSYEDFLRQTTGPAMREPAAGRSQGQPVR
jgi:predicted ATPase